MTTEYTTNLSLPKPDFNIAPWHQEMHDAFDILDGIIYDALVSLMIGPWANATAYTPGLVRLDTDGTGWLCNLSHTSATSPTTFTQDRTAHPTYWTPVAFALRPRGQWQNSTEYKYYDLSYDTTLGILALCTTAHTSSAAPNTIDDDSANWQFLIEGNTAASITYDNTTSLLTASNVQTAIDEVVSDFTTALSGVAKRTAARVATTADITIATALNNGDTLDGITLVTNDLVLVKDQAAPAQNGIYVVGATPARSTEFDTYNEHAGVLVAVQEGTTNLDTLWLCTSNQGGTLGTTALTFSRIRIDIAIPVTVAQGGTNSTTASAARTALGLAIGTDVQAFNANLTTYAGTAPTVAGLALLDDTAASDQRTTLGLGTAAVLDVGTTADKIVQLTAAAKYPAVDGSLITNLSSGGSQWLAKLTAASSATIEDVTHITNAYTSYKLVVNNLVPANDGTVVIIQVSTDGGATWKTTGYFDYLGLTTGIYLLVQSAIGVSNLAGFGISGVVYLANPAGASNFKMFSGQGAYPQQTTTVVFIGQTAGAWVDATTAINGVRLLATAGNLATGTVEIYGQKGA